MIFLGAPSTVTMALPSLAVVASARMAGSFRGRFMR